MNQSQFKDPVYHMCLDGAVVASWSLTQDVADSIPFTVMTNIFTTRKRSLGQGNMFTGVCLSTGGMVWSWGGACLGGVPVPEGGACSGGGYLLQGVPAPGGCLVETPPYGYRCGRYTSYWNAFLLSLNSANSGKTFRENSIDLRCFPTVKQKINNKMLSLVRIELPSSAILV